MVTFQNKNEFVLDALNERDTTVSTLLIPRELLENFLNKRKDYQNNTTFYLRSLLRKYRTITHSGLLPKPIKIKTEYQDEGQNLCKINFRPTNIDWIELGELALTFGKSRCWLFTYLLKLDIADLWSLLVQAGLNKVVPTRPGLELRSFSYLERVMKNFTRGYHVRT